MADEPLQPIPDPEDDEGGPVKTFLEHLEDLRWVIIRCLVALMLGMVTCLVAAPVLVRILRRPLELSGTGIKLEFLGPLGSFMVSMKIAFYGGITLALPFILYFIAAYVLPALRKTEKKYFVRAFSIGGGLFMAGVLLCYFVILQISIKGLTAYTKWLVNDTPGLWRAEEYFHFVIMFMVGMGLSFEIPVLILTLVRIGVISHETLVKSRAYLLIGNFVLCAFITPDAISTVFMVIPVWILTEICILISKGWERQKRLQEAQELAAAKQVESLEH